MLITLDCEFDDNGYDTELISIALVAENGDELYRIVEDADWGRIVSNRWVMNNVVTKHLPIKALPDEGVKWDDDHPDRGAVQSRFAVAAQVEEFFLAHGGPHDIELWADHPATDHVVTYQLFGPMIECTRHGMPMRTSCLRQEEDAYKRHLRWTVKSPKAAQELWETQIEPYRPVQAEFNKHHALCDARFDMELARWLKLAV